MPKAKEKLFEISALPHFLDNIYENKDKFSNFLEEFYSHINVFEDDFDVNFIELCKTNNNIKKINESELYEIEYTIKQINLSNVIRKTFSRLLNEQNPNFEIKETYKKNLYYTLFYPKNSLFILILKIFILISFFQKIIYELVLLGVKKRLPFIGKSLFEMKVLRSLSNQIRFKLSVMKTWPILLRVLTHEKQSANYSTILRVYIKLLSGITLIASDLILGILSLFFLYYNIQHILGFVHKYGSG